MTATAASRLFFDPAAHAYALDGVPVPSVTTVLKATGYIRLDGPAATLEVARLRGSHVHQLLHYLLEDDLDEATIDPGYAGYIASARRYLAARVTTVLRAEMRVWSARRGYAGTLDLLALGDDGRLFIGDFKTGEPADVAADLQTAAYHAALAEMAATDVELRSHIANAGGFVRRCSIRLHGDGSPATETPYHDTRDVLRFYNALNVYHDQQQRPVGLAWEDAR